MDHQKPSANRTAVRIEPRTEWGRWVYAVLDKHGLGFRQQRIRTGVPHSTITSWVQGIPPRMDGVIAFARGLGEDVNEALRIAGHPPLPPDSHDSESAADHTFRALSSMDANDPDLRGEARIRAREGRLTAEDLRHAREAIEALEREIAAELEGKGGEGER